MVVMLKAKRDLPLVSMPEAKSIFGSVIDSTSSSGSVATAMTASFWPNFFWRALNWGMAFLEGMLHEAQKLRRMNLSLRSGFSLSHLSTEISGAALPRGEVSEIG